MCMNYYKNTDTLTHTWQEGKHIWGLSSFFWQCIFHQMARVRWYEWPMWCQCASVCVYTQPGLDSCTRVCGKHGRLLLLLLPPDLCDLLHKDNRAASYPQNPLPSSPRPKTARPGSSDRGLPPVVLSDRTISAASTTTSLFVSPLAFYFGIIKSFLIKSSPRRTGNERSASK